MALISLEARRSIIEHGVGCATDRIAGSQILNIVDQQVELAGRQVLLRLGQAGHDQRNDQARLDENPDEQNCKCRQQA